MDSREHYPFRFARQHSSTYRRALPVGDYGVELDGQIIASVERKSVQDLAKCLVDGSLSFTMAELSSLDRAAVVVEDRYSEVFKLGFVAPGFVSDLLGALQVRYPNVPIVFCETRVLAEEWTFRFLGAALARAQDDAERDEG